MRLNVIDSTTLELLGVVSQYESVQWNPTFNTPDGNFQLNCDISYIDLLQEEQYIENTDVLDHVGVIKQIEVVTTNQKKSLQVKGVMLEKDIFYKRVIKAWIVYQSMYPTEVIGNIIALSLTQPPEPSRQLNTIGEVIIPKNADVPDMVEIEYSSNYAVLGDEIFTLIQNLNLGVKARINHVTNKIDIEFYTGNDFTFGSDEPIVFSPERGTVLETDYIKDSSQNITELTVVGENNIILKAERERLEGEPLIEKSLNLSSELPWPTYRVEKPNEEGGEYRRYKKYNAPADFITNRDVWEKYEVERIEIEEIRYREVESTVEKPTTIGEILKNSELISGTKLDPKRGLIPGSATSTAEVIKNATKNTNIGSVPKTIGSMIKTVVNSTSANQTQENAVFIEPVKTKNLKVSAKKASSKKKTTKNKAKKTVIKKPNKTGTSNNKGLGAVTKSGIIDASGVVRTVVDVIASADVDTTLKLSTKERTLQSYTVTTVTYETKEFLEYVYTNKSEPPSDSTKVIQGSFDSGDVMYYEHFDDVKVDESQYRDVLMKKAEDYLKTFVSSETVSIKPYFLSNLVYGQQYNLGDIVTAQNSSLGFSVDLRITQVQQIWDSKGYSIDIVLGDSVPSLTNRMKLIAKGGS